MATLLLLTRVWRLHILAPVLLIEGLVFRAHWSAGASVPTITALVPMPAVVPAVLALTVGWALVEQWPEPLVTAVRRRSLVAVARYGLVLGLGVAAARVASSQAFTIETVSLTAVGIALAAVSAIVLGPWQWVPVGVAGYLWLQAVSHNRTGDYLAHDLVWAVTAVLVAAGLTAVGRSA